MYAAGAACRELATAPAESGTDVASRTPVKHKARNLISCLLLHPRATIAPSQGQATLRTKVIVPLALLTQLSRVKMSETPPPV